ncbi:metallophosphoesterase family protein [Candidatus Woesearchaeota archaeon]|nr:metallophosphoesterase family protein [Candidatus Woesearchaeota archaeon]
MLLIKLPKSILQSRMKHNKITGKRIILSLIVAMLLSLVIVSALDEKKIKLDELESIKKLVLAERLNSFNIVKAKIERLLSDKTSDGKDKDAGAIKTDNDLAQKFIVALTESAFLTDEQKGTLTNLQTSQSAAAAIAKEKSVFSGWRLWAAIPLVLALIYMLLLRKNRYKTAGKGIGFGGKWLWLMISGKKGKLDAIERYNNQMLELENRSRTEIKYIVDKLLKQKEELIAANVKKASQLVYLGQLVVRRIFVKGHAKELLVDKKPVKIEDVGEIEPIRIDEVLAELEKINNNLPVKLNEIVGNHITIVQRHKNLLDEIKALRIKTNASAQRLANNSRVKNVLGSKIAQMDSAVANMQQIIQALDDLGTRLNRSVGVLEQGYARQNESIKLENGNLSELIRIIDKKFQDFANVAQDISHEANKIEQSFATREKRVYNLIDAIIKKIEQENAKIQNSAGNVNTGEADKLIDAATNIASIAERLALFRQKTDKITTEHLKSFIKVVKLLKNDFPEVTLEEFKEQLEGFVIVHKNKEFKIVEVSGDNVKLEGVSDAISFEQLKNIDDFLAKRQLRNLLTHILTNATYFDNNVLRDVVNIFLELKNAEPSAKLEEFKSLLIDKIIRYTTETNAFIGYKIKNVIEDKLFVVKIDEKDAEDRTILKLEITQIKNLLERATAPAAAPNPAPTPTPLPPNASATSQAKYAIISDIHSNLQAFQAVLQDIAKQGIPDSNIYCCGDIVGYGGNPNQCVQIIKDRDIKWVLGNHEFAILNPGYAEKAGFNASATAAVNWQITELNEKSKEFLNAQKQENYILVRDDFVIVHSELTKPKEFMYLSEDLYKKTGINFGILLGDNFNILSKYNKRICFIGHSHMPEIWTIDANNKMEKGDINMQDKKGIVDITNAKNVIVNVGSVGQPRDGDTRACYVIYDKENSKIAIRYVRVGYNVAAAQQAILSRIPDGYNEVAANYMAERLANGR